MYRNQSDYKQALEYYNKSLQVRIKVLGKNHPDTADYMEQYGYSVQKSK